MGTEIKTQRATRGDRGFTLTELLVVICVLALVAALLLPALSATKRKASILYCDNNLKCVGLAYRVWAQDNDNKFPMHFAVTNDTMMRLICSGKACLLWQTMSNELSTPAILYCPADTSHIAAHNFASGFSDANISYFCGLDVGDDGNPRMLVAGDDNFAVNGKPVQPGILILSTNASIGWTNARHPQGGLIVLADGSVLQTTSSTLSQFVQQTGLATNRLVIP